MSWPIFSASTECFASGWVSQTTQVSLSEGGAYKEH